VNELEKGSEGDTTISSRNSRGLVFLKAGKLRWQVRASICSESIADLLQNPEAYLANPATHFKSSRVVTVARVPASPQAPGLVLRRLNYGKFRHRLRDVFRPSRARRALAHGLMLERAGVATARAWAAAERRVLRWPLSAYLITEEIQAAATLAKLIAKNRWPSRTIVHRLANLIGRLHDQGFSHRDLKPANILFDATLEPFLIDLDGIRHRGRIGDGRAAADLAVLAGGTLRRVSAISGWRFLKQYCRARKMEDSVRGLGLRIVAKMK
jgi:tRNA A-37 threonylcarbamoyl transferase component Bud32